LLAVVNRNDTYGNALENQIRLSWCDPAAKGGALPRPGASQACKDTYISRSYGTEDDPMAGQAQALADLIEVEPDAVVLIAFEEDGIEFLNLAANSNLKNWILTDGLKSENLLKEVKDPTILCGAVGTNAAAPSGSTYNAFALDFQNRWGEKPGTYAAHAYDAAYLLAYAIAAAAKTPAELKGKDIALGLMRLSSGQEVEVGNFGFKQSPQILRNDPSTSIDFKGASGALDFDNTSGEAVSPVEGWYFDFEQQSIESLGVIYDEKGNFLEPRIDPDRGLGAFCNPDGGEEPLAPCETDANCKQEEVCKEGNCTPGG
jgi:hypothetical protein